MKYILILLVIQFSYGDMKRQLIISNIFSYGMVQQRDTTVIIRGKSRPNENYLLILTW